MTLNGATNGTNGPVAGSSPLELLVRDLNKQTKTFADYLRANGVPEPSFERDAPIINLSPQAPEEIQVAREKLLDNALQIFQLVAGPGEYLQNVITGYHYMEILRWMSHFKIFELVPLEANISYSELAAEAGVSELRLKSLARMAMTNHVFAEPAPGFIAHSATSAALVTNTKMSDQRVWMTSLIAPTIASMVTAHERWPDSTAPNKTAFNAAFNTDLPMYGYIAKQPELYKLFGRVMDAIASSPKSDLKHLVNGFDWARLGKATVIGGSIGHTCVALAKAFPDLEFIVQDIPHVVEEGIKVVRENNGASIAARIGFQAYDFFEKQPVQGADVYLFRQIFHNWDLENSAKILKNTVASMGAGSHVLIMDFVVPEPGAVPSVNERVLRSRDVGMMQLFNSLERDLEGWKAMLEAVDPRLRINAVGSAVALEAHARGARVTLALRDVSRPNEWISPEQEHAAGLQRIAADLTDPAAVTRAVHQTGAQAAFIYAVRSSDMMRGAITALRDAGIQYVVFLSTSQVRTAGATKDDIRSIERDHFIPWQHAQVEIGLEELGLPHTALRPGFFASNPLRIYLDRSTEPKQVQLLAPDVPHDPIDPEDIGRVAGALLVNPRLYASGHQATSGPTPRKDVVYLSGLALLSQSEQWDIINRELAAAGKPQVKVTHTTVEQYLRNLAARHVPEMVAKSLAKSMVETRALYAAEDYEKEKGNVELLTGRKPTSFEDFIKREIPRYFK
ncbi:S-adenosyl-L-methionine-dependent methyltransferase [Chaetomidium leptoderma]|uniref:S-adenosyl-L-methionine-dependent methyltransferase n=1 Tax=Chaetomidium leptoderma TaxID=669021 RepID=A0AAN6VDY8_9PEZI|nr:S-adenosyl-L-methionine-dependent methyltransferase [Chaetomidium leptoderma]